MENSAPTALAEGSAPASSPDAPAAPAAANPPQDDNQRIDVKSLMAQLTPDQRRLAAAGKFDQIKPAASSAPATPAAPAAPSVPVVAAPALGEPASYTEPVEGAPAAAPEVGIAEDSPDPAGDASGGKSKRFRFSDEKDQAVISFAKANGLSLIEAAQRLAAATPTSVHQSAHATGASPATTPAEPAQDPQVVAFDAQITETATRLEKLNAKRAKAIDDLDSATAASISDEIADLRSDKKLLERDKVNYVKGQEQAVVQGFERQVQETRTMALAQYPVLANTNSMARMALDAFTARAKAQRPELFSNPAWPQVIVTEFVQLHKLNGAPAGISAPAQAPAAPAKPGFQKTAPKQVINGQPSGSRLLTGADGRSPSSPSAMTRDDALALARSDPKAAVRALAQLNAGRR